VVAIHEAYRLSRIHRIAHLEDIDHSEGWDAVIPHRVAIDETIEARRALERLAELPPRQRRDLALRVAGFSYREIAKITGGRTYTNVTTSTCARPDHRSSRSKRCAWRACAATTCAQPP
jgi:DNA-directed RNA polymerase specialized sigma24 family protein